MKNNLFLLSGSLLSTAMIANVDSASAKSAKEAERPNILMISVDDLNDWATCLSGKSWVKTPNIDRLAEMGILFTNAHCVAPLSGPSRAAIFSGMLPSNSGNYFQIADTNIKKSNEKSAQITFLPEYLANNGYKTMGVGKIFHQGDRMGLFQEFNPIFHEMAFGPYLPNRRKAKYDPEKFYKGGKTSTDWSPIDIENEEMHDYKAATWAIDRLNENHEDPFLLSVGFVRPHVPWYVPQEWFDLFDINDMVTPPYKADDLDDVPQISRDLHDMPMMPQTEWLIESGEWKHMIHAYVACMAFMDAQVGRVLDALEKSEYADNTIIVLWSDHGYHLGEKGRTCKHSLWQRATHVPFIVAGLDIERGQRCDAPITTLDIYPTLLDVCDMPANKLNDGNSIVPLIDNVDSKWGNAAITQYGLGNNSIYYGDYHYIQYSDGESELYNVKSDPNEWDNITADPQYKSVKAKMKKFLPKSYADYSQHTIVAGDINTYIRSIVDESKQTK